MLTAAGHDYQEILQLKELRRLERSKRLATRTQSEAQNGGVESSVDDIVEDVVVNGGATIVSGAVDGYDVLSTGIVDLAWSEEVLTNFLSFLASFNFPNHLDLDPSMYHELEILSRR